jgi:hypothetical protein
MSICVCFCMPCGHILPLIKNNYPLGHGRTCTKCINLHCFLLSPVHILFSNPRVLIVSVLPPALSLFISCFPIRFRPIQHAMSAWHTEHARAAALSRELDAVNRGIVIWVVYRRSHTFLHTYFLADILSYTHTLRYTRALFTRSTFLSLSLSLPF